MSKAFGKSRFNALKVTVSAAALTFMASAISGTAGAQTSDYGVTPEANEQIVANHTVPPGPGTPATGANFANSPNVLDPLGEINGVGQQIAFIQVSPTAAGLALCSGTLINPRTVITAAHCVYNSPAHMYGSQTGTGGGVNGPFATGGVTITSTGIPLSFGFGSTNRCLGVAVNGNGCAVGTGPYETWRNSGFRTNTALAIYNANQVWYGTGAQPVGLGGGGEFANEDIALVTLDTHASGVPTWTLLFSPLDGPTHATITGYGGTGVGLSGIGSLAGIDYRRRSAENMIDGLMSGHDWASSTAISGPGFTGFINLQHAIYWMDFDDPDHDPNSLPANFFNNTALPGRRNNGYYDFNGLGGAALANEGATAGGDSGGPLVVDQRWDKPVVAGVLTGSFSFNGGISTYGQFNVYPPLFLFWEEIVQNNPYVYAGNRNGSRDWNNPNHWVQLMDPNYAVIGPNGELVTGVPDTHQGGADGAVDRFGTVCFLETDCQTMDGPGNPVGNGNMIVTAGGPGSRNFVPNNIEPINSADPTLHRKARYYDVTLSGYGETRLKDTVTIDRFTMDGGYTALDVRRAGVLNVLTDFTVDHGFLNVDGRINSGEALLIHGLLTGRGTFNPTYFTSVNGIIAPGDIERVGTLSIQGDTVLASGNNLLIELGRSGGDMLRILADPAQGTLGNISVGGAVWFTRADGSSPRDRQSFTFVLADGMVIDTFDVIRGRLGNLRPEVSYLANSVVVRLKAGRFSDDDDDFDDHSRSFARALDDLREGHYDDLYGLFGELDLMEHYALRGAFSSLSPGSLMDAHGLMAMQGSAFGETLQDRLALLSHSGGSPLGMSIMGSPGEVLAFGGDGGLPSASALSLTSALSETSHVAMQGGMSAFISGGYGEGRASVEAGRTATTPDDGLRTWHMFGGVEQTFGDMTFGVAGGYSRGSAMQGGTATIAENDVAQTAAYGVYRFDQGVYVSGLVGYGSSKTSTERSLMAGSLNYRVDGDTTGELFLASVEAGVNIELSPNFVLTPNASVHQLGMRVDGLSESGGEAALQIAEQRYEQLEARLGARLAGDFAFASGWTLSPSLDIAAVANLSDQQSGVWASFAAVPDASFYLPGLARDDLWGEVTGGLSLVNGDTSISLRMETSVAREELYEDRYMARFQHSF